MSVYGLNYLNCITIIVGRFLLCSLYIFRFALFLEHYFFHTENVVKILLNIENTSYILSI